MVTSVYWVIEDLHRVSLKRSNCQFFAGCLRAGSIVCGLDLLLFYAFAVTTKSIIGIVAGVVVGPLKRLLEYSLELSSEPLPRLQSSFISLLGCLRTFHSPSNILNLKSFGPRKGACYL